MHIADPAKGNLGANGIVGGGLPIAVGAALSAKKRRTGAVAVAFFGDGANNEGAFHEALNIASIWKLPVIFVCENNQYAMSMSIARSTAVANVAERASAYGMPSSVVDGNDFAAVAEASFAATDRARARRGADADRGQDLSHARPFALRPQPLPLARGDRGLEGARSDRALRGGNRGAGPRVRARGSRRSRPRSKRKWPRRSPPRAPVPGLRSPTSRATSIRRPRRASDERARALLRRGHPRGARHRARRATSACS